MVEVDLPEEDWHATVLEDAMWMAEYGAPFDLRELPQPMFQAHLAILKGRSDSRQEDAEEARDAGAGDQGVTTRGHRQ